MRLLSLMREKSAPNSPTGIAAELCTVSVPKAMDEVFESNFASTDEEWVA